MSEGTQQDPRPGDALIQWRLDALEAQGVVVQEQNNDLHRHLARLESKIDESILTSRVIEERYQTAQRILRWGTRVLLPVIAAAYQPVRDYAQQLLDALTSGKH